MTLIYELDLKIVMMYLHAINEVSRSKLPKVRASQTDRRDRKHYYAAFVSGNSKA